VDFFYLAMPAVTTAADGSQDALAVRVIAGKHEGWGECEASPLPSIAAFVAPKSHGACRPVSASVLGETLDSPDDIRRMSATVAYNTVWICCRPPTPGRASRWQCGTYWVVRATRRRTNSWAIRRR